jgi:hypothetical protein
MVVDSDGVYAGYSRSGRADGREGGANGERYSHEQEICDGTNLGM